MFTASSEAQKTTEGLILTVRDEGSPAWQFAQFLRKPDSISFLKRARFPALVWRVCGHLQVGRIWKDVIVTLVWARSDLHGLRLHQAKEKKTKFAKDSRYWQQPLLFHACNIVAFHCLTVFEVEGMAIGLR